MKISRMPGTSRKNSVTPRSISPMPTTSARKLSSTPLYSPQESPVISTESRNSFTPFSLRKASRLRIVFMVILPIFGDACTIVHQERAAHKMGREENVAGWGMWLATSSGLRPPCPQGEGISRLPLEGKLSALALTDEVESCTCALLVPCAIMHHLKKPSIFGGEKA